MLCDKQRDRNPPNIFKELLKDKCGIEWAYRTLRETQTQGNTPMPDSSPETQWRTEWETGDILPWWHRLEGWEPLLPWEHFKPTKPLTWETKALSCCVNFRELFLLQPKNSSEDLLWLKEGKRITPTPREKGGKYLEARPFKGSYQRRKDMNFEEYLANDHGQDFPKTKDWSG